MALDGAPASDQAGGARGSRVPRAAIGLAAARTGGPALLSTVGLGTGTVGTVPRASCVSGEGTTGPVQTMGDVDAMVFGIAVPIVTVRGHRTHGSSGPYSLAGESLVGTAAGGAGLVVGLIGLIGVALRRRSGSGGGTVGAAVGGALLGLVSGVGWGLLRQQASVMSPTSTTDLAVPVIALLVGLLAGALGGWRGRR